MQRQSTRFVPFALGLSVALLLALPNPLPAQAAHIIEEDIPAPILRPRLVKPVPVQPAMQRSAPVTAPVATPNRSLGSVSGATANGDFYYTVKPGDSLSSIASTFGIQTARLATANHLDRDAVLQSGKVLRLPNPFASQVRALEVQLAHARAQKDAAKAAGARSSAEVQVLRAKVDEVTTYDQTLRHGLASLPWWRGLALTAVGASLLLAGVTLVTLFEWWMLRRRFGALAALSESLRRLDYKYKAALAKAELRLQQIYGRRRPVTTEQPERRLKTHEEAEIERLDRELMDCLKVTLDRLGADPARARRGRELSDLSQVSSPAEAPTGRH